MRIGFLSTYPPTRCGIGRYTSFLVDALLRNYPFIEVCILTEEDLELKTTSRMKVIPCFKAGQFTPKKVIAKLKELKLDILHIQHHYGIFGLEEDFLNILSRVPVVVTMHEVHTEEFPEKIALTYDIRKMGRNHKILGELVRKIIVHSEMMKQSLIDFGVSAEKTTVIPHGTLLLPKIKREIALSTFSLPPEAKVILSFGFVREDKNERALIEVFHKITKEVPDAWLVTAGSVHPLTEEKDQMVVKERKEIVRRLDIKNIRFIEEFVPDDNLPTLFSMADLFVSLYDQRYREISGALHLGIGAGIPCIVTRVPRYEEIEKVTPETTVEVGNKRHLERVIVRLLKDEKLRRRIARSIKAYARETSWEKISLLHYQVYRGIKLYETVKQDTA